MKVVAYNRAQFSSGSRLHILSKLGGPASEHISSVKKAFLEADSNNLGRLPFDQFRYKFIYGDVAMVMLLW